MSNQCLVDLFNDADRSARLVRGLPKAFEMAGLELPFGNPAVGFLREHALTGFFINVFGADRVNVPERGNKRGFDILICGQELSIKTVTGEGLVKVVWTVDQDMVLGELSGKYKPDCDLLLTRIFWNKTKPSIFYIPAEVQAEIHEGLGKGQYLKANTGTNHRGIEIRKPAMHSLLSHKDTLSLEVKWTKLGLDYTPYTRWNDFWQDVK